MSKWGFTDIDKVLMCGCGGTVYATDLNTPLSACRETGGAELLKVGETFAGNPEPSLARGRCRD